MSSLLSNVRWAAVAQASRVGGQLVSLAVLSRLLPPSDYGVMAMAGVVTALVSMLRDMGTGAAIIQRKDLTPELTCTVFWMNVGLGAALALMLAFGSSALGIFFSEPQLPGVLLALALLFPLGSVTAVHQALIERRSGFKTLAAMDIVNQIVGLSLAIIAALAGAGVYSFVVLSISSTLISTIWLWRQSDFRPQWIWSETEFKGLWKFSGNLTAFNFINYFARNSDSMIIGKLLGAAALGHYSMAYKLMLFPVQNITGIASRVMFPALSKLQDDRSRFEETYLRFLSGILLISTPLMAGVWALRVPFVDVAFGSQWIEVGTLLFWLAPTGMMQAANSTTGSVLTAAGRSDLLFKLGIFSTIFHVTAFVVGAQGGVEMVAACYFLSNILSLTLNFWCTNAALGMSKKKLWGSISAPFIGSALMAGVLMILLYILPEGLGQLIQLTIGALTGAIVYLLLIRYVFNTSLGDIYRLIRPK